jgi:hypothetical protein
MDYSFCKTYQLLAQTPMIHFQHDQHGAALRPSEVKPKLDWYLRERKPDLPAAWQISREHPALNYRMQITAAKDHLEKTGITVDQCKAYFGNQGAEMPKGLVFRDCTLQIICMIPELLKLIDEVIGAFFILHNFGTRQSKGFGGFLVEGRHSDAVVEKTIRAACPYRFYADFRPGTSIQARLNHATVVYACMKNGMQMGKRIFDGYINCEYLEADIGNDQEFIRDHVVKGKPKAYDSYQFVRIVLGMADRYPYPKRRTAVQVVHFSGTTEENGKLRIPMESIQKKQGIKRFRSPVQIKIFDRKMYFLFQDDCKDILGQIFLIMEERDWKIADGMICRGQYAQAQEFLQRAKYIATPAFFDREFFMDDFVDYFNDERVKLSGFPAIWRPSAELLLLKGEK